MFVTFDSEASDRQPFLSLSVRPNVARFQVLDKCNAVNLLAYYFSCSVIIMSTVNRDLRSGVAFSHGQLYVRRLEPRASGRRAVRCPLDRSPIHGSIGFAANVTYPQLVSAATGEPVAIFDTLRSIPTADLPQPWPLSDPLRNSAIPAPSHGGRSMQK